MNVLLTGQKWFGVEVLKAIRELSGVTVSHICAPSDDRLHRAAEALGIPFMFAGTLCEATMPKDIDLIVAAHSHDFISERTLLRATYGGIGYHPSLLPLHRGRDAVKWAIRMRERVTGGTVYRLSQNVDGGNILEQEHVFIRPEDTATELWSRDLAPLGRRLLAKSVHQFSQEGFVIGTEQNEALATWEPAITGRPLFRPDLHLIVHKTDNAIHFAKMPLADDIEDACLAED